MADAQSVAEDQLRSIIERITPPVQRLDYIYERLSAFDGDKTVFGCQAFQAAAYLTGYTSDHVRHVIRASKRRGSLLAYLHWLDDLPLAPCRELPDDAVGYVYKARILKHPHIVKIGFSRCPEDRVRALSSESKLLHILEHQKPGTWLDESMAHLENRANSLDREWFLDPEREVGDIPNFFHSAISRDRVNSVFRSPNTAPHQSGGVRLYGQMIRETRP